MRGRAKGREKMLELTAESESVTNQLETESIGEEFRFIVDAETNGVSCEYTENKENPVISFPGQSDQNLPSFRITFQTLLFPAETETSYLFTISNQFLQHLRFQSYEISSSFLFRFFSSFSSISQGL
ncbi:hypothetical protein L6452_10545 [Arctium lappa]|uniref:Uncharacterized protein n=1 Tax=Arctium lappa TaxID=4217 RepID=A0ACB9DNI6_ARCLA|nr:hypothetical protein L6452_10545 [Arctium lappa]